MHCCASAQALQQRITDNTYSTTLAALPTAALKTDGSLAALDTNGGSGTVSVTQGSNAVSFSATQSGLIGNKLVITGDTSGGAWPVISGSGTAWELQVPYTGPTLSNVTWGIVAPNTANPIVTPGTSPPAPLLPPEATLAAAQQLVTDLLSFLSGGSPTATNRNATIDALNG